MSDDEEVPRTAEEEEEILRNLGREERRLRMEANEAIAGMAHGERKRKPPPSFEAGSCTELTKQLRAAQRVAEEAEAAELAKQEVAEAAANAAFDTVSKAAATGDVAAVEAWLDGEEDGEEDGEDGKRLDSRGGRYKATLLMAASGAGQERVVEVLVGRGANLDLQSTDGSTALMAAASWGRTSVVSALLEAGARTDLGDKDGWTAL
eukprot:6868186-Prymnesium_polylepis.1